MKFTQETTEKGLMLPTSALKISGVGAEGQTELHVLEDALVVLKGRMTALELLTAAHQLHQLTTELCGHLAKTCGFCTNCGDGCPLDAPESEPEGQGLRGVPPELLEMFRAGNLCLGALEERILIGGVVYGG